MERTCILPEDLIARYRVTDADNFVLADHPTRPDLWPDKDVAKDVQRENARAIGDLAHRLYGERHRSVLIIFQGMDTSGKDSATKSCFEYTPPLNVLVAAFKAPDREDLAHDYLWRIHKHAPKRGHITVFNRSHYEDVLVVRVRNLVPVDRVEQRYDQINDFERLLYENGTIILKFMLHMSYETQGERLRERLMEPDKLWKFNPDDLKDRKLWPDFMEAYERMVRRTSTHYAPWHIIPVDSRSRRGAIISSIVRYTLEQMNPQYPQPEIDPEGYKI
ncbi:MAG: polyphosphate kinase 2 family protein [Hyphomonadaceae bacterium]|nr:polyphosphate kinase 2 family protein [Hyphomonadaceae bacterium]MBC6412272.1 polyphosphate kinase 2 family protein [Hyphomonadaceae bacterium]